MSKYTDFYPASSATGFPYTGSATITGSLATTGSGNFASETPGGVTGATWAAGGTMIIARRDLSAVGTLTAGLSFGGFTTGNTAATEEYTSGTWSNAPSNMIIARSFPGAAGTQTAALAFGGNVGPSNFTEEYTSGTWSNAPSNLIIARLGPGGAGTQTAALAFGGDSGAVTTATEEYNSGTWTPGGNLITARNRGADAGTQTAALFFGGRTPTNTGVTEEYNGAAWSAGGNMNIARADLGGAGTQTNALAFGGTTDGGATVFNNTEEYNSGTWSNVPANMIIARYLPGAGTQGAAIGTGGYNGGANTPATEEFTGTSTSAGFTTNFNFDSVSGDTTVLALVQTSAAKHKMNIEPLGDQISKIKSLRPVRYNWKDRNAPEEIGFIAEEVQKVYPELVSKDETGKVSGINYAKMVSALVKTVQQQQDKIESLNRDLDDLIN